MCKPMSFVIVSVMLIMSVLPGATAPAAAQTPTPAATALDRALAAKIEAAAQDTLGRCKLPGLAIAVVKDGKVAYTKGYGVADLGKDRPVTPQTVFQTGDLAKSVVATAVMQLVAQGKLDLDAPVVKYLPYFQLGSAGFGDQHKDITIRQLLTHRSGLQDESGVSKDQSYESPKYDDAALEQYVRNLKGKGLTSPPGQTYLYSDTGYKVLGDVIAKASGQTFEAYVQEHILAPLGMTHSTFLVRDVDPQALAAPHVLKLAQGVVIYDNFPYTRERAPADGLFSTADDIARLALAHLNRGQLGQAQVLPAAAYDEMWKAQTTLSNDYPEEAVTDYGLGWYVGGLPGHKVVGHFGWVPGFSSHIYLAPDDGAAVVVMFNRNDEYACEAMTLAYQVFQWLLGVKE